jgi:hypothetical protein
MKVRGTVCPFCKEFIWSKFRHDFVGCKCGSVFIDGGQKDYIRSGFLKERCENMPMLQVEEREVSGS